VTVPAKRFAAELYGGHSDCAVLVPFDPGRAWNAKPVRIGYQKHVGHAVRGTVDGEPFEGWIWFYFREWRLVIPDSVLAAIDAEPGDTLAIAVRPHPEPETVAPYRPGAGRRRASKAAMEAPRPRRGGPA
jgi:hypothetical protein